LGPANGWSKTQSPASFPIRLQCRFTRAFNEARLGYENIIFQACRASSFCSPDPIYFWSSPHPPQQDFFGDFWLVEFPPLPRNFFLTFSHGLFLRSPAGSILPFCTPKPRIQPPFSCTSHLLPPPALPPPLYWVFAQHPYANPRPPSPPPVFKRVFVFFARQRRPSTCDDAKSLAVFHPIFFYSLTPPLRFSAPRRSRFLPFKQRFSWCPKLVLPFLFFVVFFLVSHVESRNKSLSAALCLF